MPQNAKKQPAKESRNIQHSIVRPRFFATEDRTELKTRLQQLANEIAAGLSSLETVESKELLGEFVTDLFLSVSEADRQKERRQRQAEGIAAARSRGVRFGRPRTALPENFYEVCAAWNNGEISLTGAAAACKMPERTFCDRAKKVTTAEK